jgi:hypothetical protein
MADQSTPGWVRIKLAGSGDDTDPAVVTAEAWERVWSQKRGAKGEALWVLVDEGEEPSPTAAAAAAKSAEQPAEPTAAAKATGGKPQ